MTTALTIRYIAYGLYVISLVYAFAFVLPIIFKGSGGTKSGGQGGKQSSLSDAMGTINQWAEMSDQYELNTGHARRVADLARQIGERYGLPKEELDVLECSALLHDIGQINNFDFIKEERQISFEEKLKLENHSIIGEDLSKQVANIGSTSLWVRWHHERWDGMGYPDQLAGESIPLPVRILSVADVFDALTHDRPYRQAMTTEEAMQELQRMAGIVFDPNVIQVFMSIDSESEVGRSLEV